MEAFVFAIIFAVIFGIFYLYFSTRNKERMALIEKGADASIFSRGKQQAAPFWKIFILNFALLLIGIGVGVFVASLLDHYTSLDEDAIYPSIIFLSAGLALFKGYSMTKKMDE